ncbi:chemoreceptor glutamine deamidase CheD [Methylobacillus caricis]|uniref:chemoreceptor glutamine deamidase CheD n=1 Tax=Methylobacillus caricis TaxID=1971611 RepID=UPI001CFFCFDC|nr:chemoreceptor glutamine deamidase CheD [Methylobacillus caricis]MCB5187964.1 chemoreceptor glutamine deamidase CheD [Methylobacillus caricis]
MANPIEEQLATNLYFDKTFNCEAAKILPGEYYTTNKDILIVTVLGSCVSACIRDKISGIGGMNHFMLPEGSGADANSPVSESARYGTYAMEVLINQLLKSGARRENLEAKIFGGGNVLSGFTSINIGEKNAAFVRKYLRNENIRVVGEDLNDIYPRKVYFFPRTGRVLVKKLKQMHNNTLITREESYAKKLKTNTVAGDVELF